MKNLLSVITATLVFLSQCAAADEESASGGAYIAGGPAAASMMSATCVFGAVNCFSNTSSSPTGATYRLAFGYDIDSHFGFEAGYDQLGTYTVKNPATNATVGSFKTSALTFGFRAGRIRSERRFSSFGEFGLASVRTDYTTTPAWVLNGTNSQRSTGFYVGAGGQYDVNSRLAFRASIRLISHADSDLNTLMSNVALMAVFKL